MKRFIKILAKYAVFFTAVFILLLTGSYLLITKQQSTVATVSNSSPQVRLLADVAAKDVNSTSICTTLANNTIIDFTDKCNQLVQQATAEPFQESTVCHRFFSFSFLCHTEKIRISPESSICQKLLSSSELASKLSFHAENVCEQLVTVRPIVTIVTPSPTRPSSPTTPTLTTPTPVKSPNPNADHIVLPNFPNAVQIAAVGKNSSVSGPIYFSLFYSQVKAASQPPSRFFLMLGNSFLNISGTVTSVKYGPGGSSKHDSMSFTGTADTVNKIINCTVNILQSYLSCTLMNTSTGPIQNQAIQELPGVTFYSSSFATSFGDF